jgi:hypothetical protein
MGYSKSDKAETHTHVVRVAAKRFRERGLEGIGVADVCSFYIFSGGGSVNQGLIGDCEAERRE